MPITDIIVVSVITLAFVVFAAVLAWGDYQTSEIASASRAHALSGGATASQNAGAASAVRKAGEKAPA